MKFAAPMPHFPFFFCTPTRSYFRWTVEGQVLPYDMQSSERTAFSGLLLVRTCIK
jgi:hypothetical protein